MSAAGTRSRHWRMTRFSSRWTDDRSLLPTTSIWSDESGGLHGRMLYDGTVGSRLVLRSTVASHLARGHRELLSIRAPDGAVLVERMLDAGSDEVATDISAVGGAASSTAVRFLLLGIEHILTGYDHLLFLAGVLVVLRGWRDVVQTITAFTVAHSITLALATTGLVLVPGRIVEPLIAASIVYVGIENLMQARAGLSLEVDLWFWARSRTRLRHGAARSGYWRQRKWSGRASAGVVQRGCGDRANGGRRAPRAGLLVAWHAADVTDSICCRVVRDGDRRGKLLARRTNRVKARIALFNTTHGVRPVLR